MITGTVCKSHIVYSRYVETKIQPQLSQCECQTTSHRSLTGVVLLLCDAAFDAPQLTKRIRFVPNIVDQDQSTRT
jgi:hypothetical protein